ncbi:uncharacterized protein [Ptychodera flava]|uniref:uncharacterized protein n=1 Tax=Ptychodera flava TaxID=63121 RepID=UPI00396A2481
MGCNKEFNIRELRDHLWTCTARSDEDEDDVSYDRNEEQEDLNIIDLVDNTSDTANGTTNMIPNMDVQQSAAASNPDNTPMDDSLPKEETVDDVVTATYEYCNTNSVSDPVEILKIFQSKMVTGRKLDIEDSAVLVEGETNFIMVDRSNILRTAIDEICLIDNPRLTLEVEFYGEEARDLGGPRKEFFTEVLREIHDKYFENGLKQHLEEDYKTVGVIMGLSTLQNGRIPQFMGEEVRRELFQSPFPSLCIEQLRRGFDKLGICKLAKKLPLLLHLFVPNANSALTFRKLKTLLKPKFSPEGSNNRKHENDVYTIFIAYMREAAGGRRCEGDITLNHILKFVTCDYDEPILGYTEGPAIDFYEVPNNASFLPTANTCINMLKLPRATHDHPLPDKDTLFKLYDYAFSCHYFGAI